MREIGWTLLGALLAALLATAFLHDRAGWPGLVAGEATYLMQAESLARDRDLVYGRADFDRLLLRWHRDPTDLELASGAAGRIAFDRPFPYALYLAPFLAWRPENGFAVANALVLALVSVMAARTLGRRIGAWAPLLVTVLVFASALFAHVFFATGDLFGFAAALAAFCLLAPVAGAGGDTAVGPRAAAAGALLMIPAATEPLHAVLLAAAFLVPAAAHRATARRALAAGAAAMLAAIAGVGRLAAGGLSLTRFRFTPETGFPLVDFPAAEWAPVLARLETLRESVGGFAWGVDLWLWNLLYLFFGRTIGLVPYFAPLILLLCAGPRRLRVGGRWAIVAAAGLWALAVVILRPFDLHGGEGAVANRLFLPVYGALWLVAGRPAAEPGPGRRAVRVWLAAAVTLAVAALFLGRLWSAPGAHPSAGGRGYRHPTPVARAILPYETTQRRLSGVPSPAGRWVEHGGLRVKPLSDDVWAEVRRRRLVAAGPAEVLIAGPGDLAAVRVEPEEGAAAAIRGGKIGLRRRHPVWWSGERQVLYLLSLELPRPPTEPVGFRLVGELRDGR